MKTILVLLATFMFANFSFADLTIYTDRNINTFDGAVAEFEAATGKKVVFNGGNDYFQLANDIESAVATGSNSADLFITKDIMFLTDLKDRGLSKAFPTTLDISKVYPSMQDEDRNYVGLTFRARSIAFSPMAMDASELTTYEDLADPKWAGRLCLRTGFHSYNISLVSYLLDKHGEVKTKEILKGWLDNLAAPIFPNDRAILQAIATGQDCEVGIVNHYYLANAIAASPNFPVEMAFLEQGNGGVHTNGMGVALLSASSQEDLAAQFVQILLSEKQQLHLSASHFDFPVLQGLEANTFVSTWGPFEVTQTPWSSVGTNVIQAIEVMTEVGYK